jgi:hypothetical protein
VCVSVCVYVCLCVCECVFVIVCVCVHVGMSDRSHTVVDGRTFRRSDKRI